MTCTDGLSRKARQRGWLRLQMTDCQAKGRQRTCGALATATLVRPAREAEGHGDEQDEAGTPPRGARPLAFPGLIHSLKECAACLAGWGVPTLLPPSRRSEVSQGCDALPQEDGAIGGLARPSTVRRPPQLACRGILWGCVQGRTSSGREPRAHSPCPRDKALSLAPPLVS